MDAFSQSDIERLVRGERIEPKSFRAILDDPAAVERMGRLVQSQEHFKQPHSVIVLIKRWVPLLTAAASILLGLGCALLWHKNDLQARTVESQHRLIALRDNQIYQHELLIRELREEFYDLKQRIDDSGLSTAITLNDPKAFRVTGRDRVEVSGEVNPKFIQEVRVRWGPKPYDAAVTLYKGGPEPEPQSKAGRFSQQSPAFPLNGEPIAPTLEVVPYPEMQRLFPEHFPPDKLQYSRNFLLARNGIQADPELVTITSPSDGERVEQYCQIDGQIGVKDGQLIVFVKPPGISWWVQDPAMVADGIFAGSLNVGNETTPPGTKFRIVVVVARSEAEASRFRPGTEMPALPPGLIRSNAITVIRK